MKFAKLVKSHLRGGKVAYLPDKRVIGVVGQLDIGTVIANVTVVVPVRFEDLKKRPPYVYCHEPWVKEGVDWHNPVPLCWVLHTEWRDVMGWGGKPVDDIMAEGLALLVNEVRRLLSFHHYAELAGITEWQEDWPAWSHDEAGVREYKRERGSA